MKYFIDSNVFLRYFIKESRTQHKECLALIRAIINKKIKAVTSHFVLAEIAWTMQSYYKVDKPQIVAALRAIETMPGISFTDSFNTAHTNGLFEKKNVKYIDCLIASIKGIASGEITIVSYDKDFDKLGVKRVTPTQALEEI